MVNKQSDDLYYKIINQCSRVQILQDVRRRTGDASERRLNFRKMALL